MNELSKKVPHIVLICTVFYLLFAPTGVLSYEPAPVVVPVVETPPATAYELAVRYFGDNPAMMSVIKCESSFSQYRDDGTPKISPTNDVGIAQIHIDDWADDAMNMNLDIFTSTEDNLKMAKYILDTEGISQWTCSK